MKLKQPQQMQKLLTSIHLTKFWNKKSKKVCNFRCRQGLLPTDNFGRKLISFWDCGMSQTVGKYSPRKINRVLSGGFFPRRHCCVCSLTYLTGGWYRKRCCDESTVQTRRSEHGDSVHETDAGHVHLYGEPCKHGHAPLVYYVTCHLTKQNTKPRKDQIYHNILG